MSSGGSHRGPAPATYGIVFTGVGGQGVVTAAQLAAKAALASGLDLRMYGSYGMAQRGGAVWAHLRIGERVLNARIERGEANLLVGMELLEAARSAPLLAPGGSAVVHRALLPPAGAPDPAPPERLEALIGAVCARALFLDAGELAGPLGERGVNAVLLGAASLAPGLPMRAGALEGAIKEEFGRGAGPVLRAFRRGRKAAGGGRA
ncbi:MAG: 2-oxoacid:acceptor oxidoreductase family protein [Thermoplasmatota archaeon]